MKRTLLVLTAVITALIFNCETKTQTQTQNPKIKTSTQISKPLTEVRKADPVKEIYSFVPENEEKLMYGECKNILTSKESSSKQGRRILNLIQENARWYKRLNLTEEEKNRARVAAYRGIKEAKEKFQNWS